MEKRYVLTLSGGGFRATLFHIGVIWYLGSHNLLKNVEHIVGVSGGSILAAHIGLYWKKYRQPENWGFKGQKKRNISFDNAKSTPAGEVIDFIRTDLRRDILFKWVSGVAIAIFLALIALIVLCFSFLIPSTYWEEPSLTYYSIFANGLAESLVTIANLFALASETVDKKYYLTLLQDPIYVGIFFIATSIVVIAIALRRNCKILYLIKQYDNLYRRCTLDKLPNQFLVKRSKDERNNDVGSVVNYIEGPMIHFLTTGLRYGQLISISRGEESRGSLNLSDGSKYKLDKKEQRKVSYAVAASSAFPPLFRPMRVHLEEDEQQRRAYDFKTRRRETGSNISSAPRHATEHLTDGGVFDNLGRLFVDHFPYLADPATDTSRKFSKKYELYTSNASAHLAADSRVVWGPVSRNIRAFNISTGIFANTITKDCIDIRDCYTSDVSSDLLSKTKTVRTDLNGFTKKEIVLLITHGYVAAKKKFAKGLSQVDGRGENESIEEVQIVDDVTIDDFHLSGSRSYWNWGQNPISYFKENWKRRDFNFRYTPSVYLRVTIAVLVSVLAIGNTLDLINYNIRVQDVMAHEPDGEDWGGETLTNLLINKDILDQADAKKKTKHLEDWPELIMEKRINRNFKEWLRDKEFGPASSGLLSWHVDCVSSCSKADNSVFKLVVYGVVSDSAVNDIYSERGESDKVKSIQEIDVALKRFFDFSKNTNFHSQFHKAALFYSDSLTPDHQDKYDTIKGMKLIGDIQRKNNKDQNIGLGLFDISKNKKSECFAFPVGMKGSSYVAYENCSIPVEQLKTVIESDDRGLGKKNPERNDYIVLISLYEGKLLQ